MFKKGLTIYRADRIPSYVCSTERFNFRSTYIANMIRILWINELTVSTS